MNFMVRLFKLILGLFLYSVGIIFTINANIGYAPWDIFHVGLSLTTGISLGNASILTGFIVLIFSVLMGEKFGIGTIGNMVCIGLFMDLIIYLKLIPIASQLVISVTMFFVGIVIICFATYFYIISGFGAGPRDSIMVALSRKINLSIGASRALIEFIVAVMGYFLGGIVGLGTVIYVLSVGPIMQVIFSFLKFDPKDIEHEDVKETFRFLMKK